MADQNNWQQQVWQQPPVPQGGGQPPVPQYGYQPPNPAPQKKSYGWAVAIVIILGLFALVAVGMVSCSNMFAQGMGSLGSSASGDIGPIVGDSVGVITIDGTIQYDATTSSPEGLKKQLDKAEDNPHIKAVVLRIDSGGGVATAGEEMTQYVKEFSKPVVVSSASMNASAAYEISSQADYIYTAKTTAIGSIGTALSVTDLSGLYEKLGIRVDDITSSKSKDSSYGNRALTDEERLYFQDMVDQINQTFIEAVAEGRGMSVDEVNALATGLNFTGMDAVENGLADEIGTLENATAKAAELAGISEYETVPLQDKPALSPLDLFGILGASSGSVSPEDLAAALKELSHDGAIAR